jgi:hypothetical protein
MTSSLLGGKDPSLVSYPLQGAYRVARRDAPLELSWISAADVQMPSGNRYDVAGGGVPYCAKTLEACYAETLAGLRPSPSLIARLGAHEDGRMNLGTVPVDRRMRLVRLRVLCDEPLPFIDVEDPSSSRGRVSSRARSYRTARAMPGRSTAGGCRTRTAVPGPQSRTAAGSRCAARTSRSGTRVHRRPPSW